MIQLSNSVVQAILSAAPAIQTGNIFALPVVATQFTWQTSFTGTPTAIAIQILTSLDGTNFVLAASSTSTAGESKTVLSSAAFIQARIDTVTPGPCTLVTVSVIAEEGHDVIQGGGGGAALPTAPVGQVLISQGAGVDPIFSSNPLVARLDTGAAIGVGGILLTTELYLGGVSVVRRDGSNGTLVLSGNDSMITIPEKTLAGLFSPSFVGTLANISDSTVNTIGAAVTGGGTNRVLARWNGTNWIVIGGPPALPTAPVGQVLISQGAGVAPIFSAGPSVSSINGEFGVSSGQGSFKGNSVIMQAAFTLAQLTPGTFIGTLADISDSTVTTWGATVVGGGSNRVLARWNGTVWKVIGV